MEARKRKTAKTRSALQLPEELNFLIEKRDEAARRQVERRAREADADPAEGDRRASRDRRQSRRRQGG